MPLFRTVTYLVRFETIHAQDQTANCIHIICVEVNKSVVSQKSDID